MMSGWRSSIPPACISRATAERTLGRNGHSKDSRPDLHQMVLGVVIDETGRPICSEMWPGNTADVTTLIPMVTRLRQRFQLNRVCIIADRGMVSAKTIATLEAQKIEYILGVREKRSVEIAAVLADKTPFVSLTVPKANGRGTLDLQVKEVIRKVKTASGQQRRCRYIVCYNEAEARNDAAAREAALAGLEKALRQGDKALVGNKGFRRFLKIEADSHFAIDPDRVAAAAKFDGIYVIRTNARSRRWLSRSAIASDGSWRIFSGPRNPSSIHARSFTSVMIRFAAMCSAHSLLCCCARN